MFDEVEAYVSKLSDRIKELGNRGVRPMGFATAATTQAPAILLVASISSQKEAAKAESDGAEAVLSVDKPGKSDSKRTLFGQTLATAGKADLEALAKDGVAFVVLTDTKTSATALTVEDIDVVLTVDTNWTDMLTRSVAQLPIAAVVYQPPSTGPMTIDDHLQCARVMGLVGKPVFVVVPSGWGTESLLALQEAGVTGVIVSAGDVATYRDAIKALPTKKRDRDRNDSATLPMQGHRREAEPDDDDDDED